MERRLPIGAEPQPGGGTHFRVWAPKVRRVDVELFAADGKPRAISALTAERDGYFSGLIGEAKTGDRYKFKLERGSFPDPASRFQPEGPHGPSQIVDPKTFSWTDASWRGRSARELVVYEVHLGTFTREGTWRAAMGELPELARVGITMIEIMPIAEFPGRFGWGYDGVGLFAPTRLYGSPEDVRAFVNRAHEVGIAVILDVVYNHFGPDGNYLREFSPDYFHPHRANEWGDALNFDGDNAKFIREFFCANARYWIEEFHLDGLRLDATQQIHDASAKHILAEIGEAARRGAHGRPIWISAESETQDARLARPLESGGCGLDAIWNDDFHHVAQVAATGRNEAYYSDYRGTAQEFISAAKYGFLFQGQRYEWQDQPRGSPALDLTARNFVIYLQNHDQVANSFHGRRLQEETSAGRYRALTGLLLLLPQVPLLFQGQEFAASAPFYYFADHAPGLREDVAKGRRKFIEQFATCVPPHQAGCFIDPSATETFDNSKLDFGERERHAPLYRLHEDLLRLRREDRMVTEPARLDGAVLAPEAFVLRYFSTRGDDDRLLIVNLGGNLRVAPAPEPLLAPLAQRGWRVAWSSDLAEYGGAGAAALETDANWMIPGHSCAWLAPAERREFLRARLTEKRT